MKFLQECFETVTLPKSLNLVDKNQCILQPMALQLTSSRCCNLNLQNQTSWIFHLMIVLTVLLKVVRWMLFCVTGVIKIKKLKSNIP